MSDAEDNLPKEEEILEDEDETDSSEEESDDQNEYEDDGFVVNEAEEEGEEGEKEGSDDEVKKKKKKKKRKAFELDEEDYDLLEDNQVTVKRPELRKRLKKREDERKVRATDQKQLQQDLFGDDDELQDLEDEEQRRGGAAAEEELDMEEDFDDDDEMGGFIVHGNEDENRPKQRRRKRTAAVDSGISAHALNTAAEIFGDVDDLLEMYQASKQQHGQQDEATLAEQLEQADFDDDEDGAAEYHESRERRAQENALKKAQQVVPHETLAEHLLLPSDQLIRDTDVPERLQLLGSMYTEEADTAETAEWIYEQLFSVDAPKRLVKELVETGWREVEGNPPDDPDRGWYYKDILEADDRDADSHGYLDLRRHRAIRLDRTEQAMSRWRSSPAEHDQLKANIRTVIDLVFKKREEVSLVAMYRKEACEELLCMRKADLPETSTGQSSSFPAGTIQARHRRIRRWDVLWSVYDYALKYRQLQQRKALRRKAYEAALQPRPDGAFEDLGPEEQDAISTCIELLDQARTVEELDDVDAKFKLISEAEPEVQLRQMALENGGAGARKPQQHSKYRALRRAGVPELLSYLGITAAQLAENIQRSYEGDDVLAHVTTDGSSTPEDCAQAWMEAHANLAFEDTTMVLNGLRHLAAVEIAAEPAVRRRVREQLLSRGQLDTEPTPEGEERITPFHKYGRVKRLRAKPLGSLDSSDLYLRAVKAQEEKLLTAKLSLPELQVAALLEDLENNYLSDGISEFAKKWNDERRAVLAKAVKELLLPQIEREVSARLLREAREVAQRLLGEALWDLAKRGPVRLPLADAVDGANMERPRLMAVCWGPGGTEGSSTVVVMLDEYGNLKDLLQCGQLSGNIPRTARDPSGQIKEAEMIFHDIKKSRDVERIKRKILEHRPNQIVLGASAPQCKQLYEDLSNITGDLLDTEAQFIRDLENGALEVKFANERVAGLWENCKAASDELPEQAAHVRRAVALARMQLDPLALLASLAGPRQELLSLSLYDMQDALSEEERTRAVEQQLITAANQVGADINLMAMVPWRAHMLQFVCGLGPRKAQHLLKTCQRHGGYLDARRKLLAGRGEDDEDIELGVLGKRVFRNCAPFLKVHDSGQEELANARMTSLDDSRIHPESYRLALQVANTAMDEYSRSRQRDDDGSAKAFRRLEPEELEDEGHQAELMEAVLQRPRAVAELDLDALRHSLPENQQGRLATLLDIGFELVEPFGELREEADPLGAIDLELMLHGERGSLLEGQLVEVQVVAVRPTHVQCRLCSSGLEARIQADNLSSAMRGPEDMHQFVQVGQVLTARVLELKMDTESKSQARTWVDVSTRSADLADWRHWERQLIARHDAHYHIPSEEEEQAMMRARQQQVPRPEGRKFVKRQIRHPHFLNESVQEVAAQVAALPPGECRMRPSVKGPQMLGLTLKLHESPGQAPDDPPLHIIKHFDIKEGNKTASARLTLGLPLTIDLPGGKAEQYEELDEVLARFVEPLMDNVRALLAHRKFKDGTNKQVVDADVTSEFIRTGSRQCVYCLALDYSNPGMGYIAWYGGGSKPHHDYFQLSPDGFYFRKKVFRAIDAMLNEFKVRPQDPARQMPPQGGPASQYYGAQQQQQFYQQQPPQQGFMPQGAGGGYPPRPGFPPQAGQQPFRPQGYSAPGAGAAAGYGYRGQPAAAPYGRGVPPQGGY